MKLALCALLALCVATCHARQLYAEPADPMNPAALCDPVSNTTIEPPANSVPVFSLLAEGSRNYTCKDGKVDKSWALANISTIWSADGEDYGGLIYYYPDGVAAFDITNATTGELIGSIPLIAPPVTQPAPSPEDLAWARFEVQEVVGDLPVVSYVVRNETVGGAPPAVCDAAPGEYIIVPSTFRLTYYACDLISTRPRSKGAPAARAMDKLKALVAAKRKAAEEEFGGKKYVRRGEIEELRLAKLREEEAAERQAKEARRRGGDSGGEEGSRPASRAGEPHARPDSRAGGSAAPTPAPQELPREEVIRRLRALGEPVTLFGESDEQRFERMLLAEQNVQVEDEARGGGEFENLHIKFKREAEKQKKAGLGKKDKASGRSSALGGDKDGAGRGGEEGPRAGGAGGDQQQQDGGDEQQALAEVDPEQQRLMDAFKAAAEAVKEQSMPVEDRVAKWLRIWMKDWEDDLEARPDDIKTTAGGYQADMRFKETQQYLKPLYARLKNRSLDPTLLAGLVMIVEHCKERNYLAAYEIYMGVSVGNAAWPIGVTQVGLHERSAREKIRLGAGTTVAHIMNDEATRKFIQAIKRLMTFCQRRYPTDPSRCVDFDGFSNAGRGAVGGGGDKAALLEALAKGEALAPAPAPAKIDPSSGAVRIPQKWDAKIRSALQAVEQSDAMEHQAEQEAAAARAAERA
ncbi:pre-mRNA-splicing factor 18-like isoform A [Chlorella sorokiniana]|uniref:Pre-mRNA-splicing factor 18 n=1 Tax=Chlorella sorokiniana TaxID=3076 RepID=A0A2P6TMM3_CHLSO|nr:pre-mRNA-splicing factor 18-like isoform A [Chlorella sorokiniana]|eukprot:PRW45581.1 pre-mRNA-splicing factor 18-like isoform A [Chlorella sorokiniana]